MVWSCAAHRALLGGPVPESLAVALVDVDRLVAEPRAPGVVVDVPHHLRLYLLATLTVFGACHPSDENLNMTPE